MSGGGPGAGLIIASPASGSGKTILTLGALRALARAGASVAGAKAGPDYIDPAFHSAAGGRPAPNLDPWAMRADTLAAIVTGLSGAAELILCEGVMGLFDGASDGTGSTADLAALTGWPVVLVADVRAQGASAAATVEGFARFRPDVAVAGVVFNRVAGPGHEAVLRAAMAERLPELTVLGCLERDPGLSLPERHLGLVQAGEHEALEAILERAADAVEQSVDLGKLRELARPARLARSSAGAGDPTAPLPPLGQRIAVARDEAFAFAYEAVLEGWRAAGAEVTLFSPLAGDGPDADADAVYLPGGYPELHAGRIAASGFLQRLRAAAAGGAAVYGECGGYMVLGRVLEDAEGRRHEMAGLLALETSFAAPRLHLGYRRARLARAGPLGDQGQAYRGHEFHYANAVAEGPGTVLFRAEDARGTTLGPTGLVDGNVMGSFVHLIDRA
jgi:cobyrinic acid a,c-diamide synthase